MVLPLAGLASCGSQTDASSENAATSPAPASPSSDLPSCSEVWVNGETLPGKYAGCFDGEVEVPAERRECSIGRPIVTYGDEFYAVPGRVVNQVEGGLEGNADFADAVAACTG